MENPVSWHSDLTYADYARFAALPLPALAEQCSVDAFHATGPGGQGVNTADSAVRMTHGPTGITVVSRESRSQFRNRQLCLQKLRDEFAARAVPPKERPKGSQHRRLVAKHQRSAIKEARRKPGMDE